MKDSFYSSFEGEHRGNRDEIKNRLRTYMPFLMPFKKISDKRVLLDLGCGRGEWLELTREEGFSVKGADLDAGMLSYCYDLELDVVQEDAINFLKKLPDNYADVISSFHVVEHIGFSNVQALFNEAFRVLKPGGIIIIETPNSENIVVGSNSFYLDPTHEKPIPHQLLSFLAKNIGFKRNKILRLQEKITIDNKKNVELIDVLAGVSPDYSLIAQKEGAKSIMALFDSAFSKNFGISLNEVADKFNTDLNHRFYNLNVELSELNKRIYDISQQSNASHHNESEDDFFKNSIELLNDEFTNNKNAIISLNNLIESLKTTEENNVFELKKELMRHETQTAELKDSIHNVKHEVASLHTQVNSLQHELMLIQARLSNNYYHKAKNKSKSVIIKFRNYCFFNKAKQIIKLIIKRFLSSVKSYIFAKPKLKNTLIKILYKLKAYDAVKKLYFRVNPPYNIINHEINNDHDMTSHSEDKTVNMSERTRRIYQITKSTMDKK